MRKRLYEILEFTEAGDRVASAVNALLLTLICLSVLSIIVGSERAVPRPVRSLLGGLDALTVAVFSLEYVLRLWTCVESKRFSSPVAGRVRFAFTPLALVDLLAVLPFYMPLLLPVDLRFLRAARLFRMLRILKLVRHSKALRSLQRAFVDTREELEVVAFVVAIVFVLASTVMYDFEHQAQPGKFGSIVSTMWWGVVTLTTVGYGDVYPVTPAGKLLSGLIAVLGIGLFAIPAGILASAFAGQVHGRASHETTCPNCGHKYRSPPDGPEEPDF